MERTKSTLESMVNIGLFEYVYRNKKVLITGHTGFKGSWLTLWLQKLGAEVFGISVPGIYSEHYTGLDLKVKSYDSDIRDLGALSKLISEIQPDIIFHLAAQAIVIDSYEDPGLTYSTNVMGTFNVFESVRKSLDKCVVINVTSDKVYKNLEWPWAYREVDGLGGYDPYSSSKAMSELLTDSFRNSFFNLDEYKNSHEVLIASARAGNVIGGGDWAKYRIIPDVFRAVKSNTEVIIRNPNTIRPWQHVLEPLNGYLLLGASLLNGNKNFAKAWNFGPSDNSNLTVGTLVAKMSREWSAIKYTNGNEKGFHEAKVLKLDHTLASQELNWNPVLNTDETIKLTVDWYREYIQNQIVISETQLEEYMKLLQLKNSSWLK